MRTYFPFISFVLFFALSASASETIRVAVADNQKTVSLKSQSGLKVEGRASHGADRKIIYDSSTAGNLPVRIVSGGDRIQVNGRSYRGRIELRKKKNGLLLVINDLNIEDYLKGVIPSEIPYDWEPEALKAQAVASRTYALYRKRTSGARPYHVFATVNGQVYGGRSGERETTDRAVRETEGIVITYNGEVIPAFYHSSCGGHTENASELWGIDEPYLKGVDCDCQEISKYGLWEKRIGLAEVAATLGRQGYRLKGITGVEIDGVTAAGRVKRIVIRDAGRLVTVPAEKFRAAVGYSEVPSVFFEVSLSGKELTIYGRGLGHGVGLCQWGAKEMAQRGKDYKAILSHYYPGTTFESRE